MVITGVADVARRAGAPAIDVGFSPIEQGIVAGGLFANAKDAGLGKAVGRANAELSRSAASTVAAAVDIGLAAILVTIVTRRGGVDTRAVGTDARCAVASIAAALSERATWARSAAVDRRLTAIERAVVAGRFAAGAKRTDARLATATLVALLANATGRAHATAVDTGLSGIALSIVAGDRRLRAHAVVAPLRCAVVGAAAGLSKRARRARTATVHVGLARALEPVAAAILRARAADSAAIYTEFEGVLDAVLARRGDAHAVGAVEASAGLRRRACVALTGAARATTVDRDLVSVEDLVEAG